jgi:hypothetical protein
LIALESLGEIEEIQMNTRCLFQNRARKKLLERLDRTLDKIFKSNSTLYLDDIIFEIKVLKCKDCKITVYRDGSWIDKLCDKHFTESKQL